MPADSDYNIKKLEKGPLQRFKNQNLLLKKFGEVGLQIYKVITGKRTANELRKDLDIEESIFFKILEYMKEAGMVELTPLESKESAVRGSQKAAPAKDESEEIKKIEEPEAEEEKTEDEDVTPIEEPTKENEEEKEESIEPEEEIKPIEPEITPIDIEKEEKEAEEEKTEDEEVTPIEEPTKENEEEKEETEEIAKEDVDLGKLEPETEKIEEPDDDLSPVEKIIKNKYGEVGIKVYHLIDGQRTAEEIMKETGLTETKLVEILDFMDEQGIIKLEYPKDRQKQKTPEGRKAEPVKEGFVPMIEEEGELIESRKDKNPVETPIKMPIDIVRWVQIKAKTLLKFGDRGAKLLNELTGKNDVVDLVMKLDMPLYEVYDILGFLLENGAIMVSTMSRTDVKKKYGDDGFSVYKKYGREGLMLYELISKEMTLKQMAEKITKDKEKVIEMFVFIHQVLGIDLPIDKEVLRKQLGA